MQDNNPKVVLKASSGHCALNHGDKDIGEDRSRIGTVEPIIYLVRELREAYPSKDVKVRVGDVVVVVSEPRLGNRLFGLVSELIKKLLRFAS